MDMQIILGRLQLAYELNLGVAMGDRKPETDWSSEDPCWESNKRKREEYEHRGKKCYDKKIMITDRQKYEESKVIKYRK